MPAARRFLALDAMRGIAAIAVALFHFDESLVPGGYLAVDFFFALSGFVLVTTYAPRLAAGLSPSRFIRLRIVRLFPLHVLGIAFGGVLAAQAILRHRPGHMGHGELVWAAVFNTLMLPTPFSAKLFPLNGPAWSLFLEMLSNVAMVLVLVKLRMRGLLVVVTCAAALLLLAIICTPSVYDAHSNINFAIAGGPNWTGFGIALARTLFSFSVGMAIANLPRATVRGQRGWTLPCGIGLLVLLAVPVPVQARLAYDLGFVFLASPLILYGCSRFEPDRRLAPIAGLIGELSFALYLINYPMKGVFAAIANRWHAPEPLLAILYLAVCFALAWAAVRWFDTPARSFLGRMIGRSDRA